jgi:hypothetical protein
MVPETTVTKFVMETTLPAGRTKSWQNGGVWVNEVVVVPPVVTGRMGTATTPAFEDPPAGDQDIVTLLAPGAVLPTPKMVP